jgi:hypothetical protein
MKRGARAKNGAIKDPREVITDVDSHYYGLVVNDQSLTPGADPAHRRNFFRGLAQSLASSEEA